MKILLILEKTLEKQKLHFSRSALIHMKTRVSLKYLVNDCRSSDERRRHISDFCAFKLDPRGWLYYMDWIWEYEQKLLYFRVLFVIKIYQLGQITYSLVFYTFTRYK